jgi:hypothetical protein
MQRNIYFALTHLSHGRQHVRDLSQQFEILSSPQTLGVLPLIKCLLSSEINFSRTKHLQVVNAFRDG